MPIASPRPRVLYLVLLQILLSLFGVNFAAGANLHIIETTLSAQVRDKTITSIVKGSHGELYIATQEGLYVFDGRETRFIMDTSLPSKKLVTSSIGKMVVAPNGNIWFANRGQGIHYIVPETGEVISPGGLEDLREKSIQNLLFDKGGKLWITNESSVWQYDFVSKRLLSGVFPLNSSLGRIRSNAMALDSDGTVWLGSDTGLWKRNRNLEEFERVLDIGLAAISTGKYREIVAVANEGFLLRFSTETNSFLERSSALQQEYMSATGIEFVNDFYALSSDQGLFLFNASLEQTERFTTENSLLSNDHITGMVLLDNSIYVSTFRGLSTAVFTPLKWFDQLNSGIDDEVLSMTESNEGDIWIGTYDGIYSRSKNRNTHFPLLSNSTSSSIEGIRSMDLAVATDYALVGTWESGLMQSELDRTSSPYVKSIKTQNLVPGSITKIFYSDERTVWVGSYSGELYQLHAQSGGVAAENIDPMLVLDGPILNISSLDSRTLVVATERSLYLVGMESGDLTELVFQNHDLNSSPIILSLHISQQQEIWLGTLNEGIYKSSPLDSTQDDVLSFSRIKYPNGNHTFYAIESSLDGDIWASSNRGIVAFDKLANYKGTIGKQDGLKSVDFNQGSSLVDSNGNLYFGGSNGYTVFNPAEIDFERKPSPMLLTGLDIAGDQSTPSTALPYIQHVEISYRDRFITFMFNVIDYFDSTQNRYRYMLEGFDPDWVEAGDRDSATFTNLPAGNYVFRAQGSNSDGVWNREGITVDLLVHPAPWRSSWSYTLYALLLMILLWFLKKTYDTYALNEKATAMAENMNRAVEDAMDDLQEQLEGQDTLVKRLHHRNLDTLGLLATIEKQSWPGQPKSYLAALEALESTLSYQSDQLLFDLQACTNRIITSVLAANPAEAGSVNTILDIPKAYLPARLGSYLAIALYEVTNSAVVHSSTESQPGGYIQIAMTVSHDHSVSLTVQSNPGATADSSRQQANLAHLRELLHPIGATVNVEVSTYTRIVVNIPQPNTTDQEPTSG